MPLFCQNMTDSWHSTDKNENESKVIGIFLVHMNYLIQGY